MFELPILVLGSYMYIYLRNNKRLYDIRKLKDPIQISYNIMYY